LGEIHLLKVGSNELGEIEYITKLKYKINWR